MTQFTVRQTYRLSGYLHPLDRGPGFVTPVFQGDKCLLGQEVAEDKDKVKDFYGIALSGYFIPALQDLTIGIGDSAVYAYSVDGHTVVSGARETLEIELRCLLNDSFDELLPVAREDIQSFLGDDAMRQASADGEVHVTESGSPRSNAQDVIRLRALGGYASGRG